MLLNFCHKFCTFIGDHSYITSALVGGKGGSENAKFCLFLVLITCLHRGGGQKIVKICLGAISAINVDKMREEGVKKMSVFVHVIDECPLT